MIKLILAALAMAIGQVAIGAIRPPCVVTNDILGTRIEVNYDESRIRPYRLEDPLVFKDGRHVVSAGDWEVRRREILGIFANEMYGAEPPAPETVIVDLLDEKETAAGFAVRRRYRMFFRADRSGPSFEWTVWIPKMAKRPVPVVSFLNYRGAHELVSDADLPVPTGWTRDKGELSDGHRLSGKTRGLLLDQNRDTIFPLQGLVARGYAVMTACYCDVSPDPNYDEPDPAFRQDPFAYTGVFELWGERDPMREDNVTSIGAWAWALSRGLDLAERIPEIDAKRSVVTGCSRLGKAALLAAARDTRFRVCAPVQTGGGGAPLAKRNYGENVRTETVTYTHWYCKAYAKYAESPEMTLSFDQHLLLAAVAPRALLVHGFDRPWFDTKGEYLAVKAASPVWEFLKKGGMPSVPWPDDFSEEAIGCDLGYVRRSGGHGIAAYDWKWMLDFANRVFAGSAAAPAVSDIGDVLRASVAKGEVAGVVSAVSRPDYSVRIDCAGYADIERRIPMRPDTMFAMFSSSKSVCGTAVMILVADGKISLDDPVSKYLPEFADVKVEENAADGKVRLVPPKTPVTIRHLMSHTSGTRYNPEIIHRSFPLRECARRTAMTPFKFHPGETFSYNNGGIDSGGAVVEAVSAMPYERFCEERIFKPLGMKDTTFTPNAEQVSRLARCYNGDGKTLQDQSRARALYAGRFYAGQLEFPVGHPIYPAPSAGLYSTPLDFVRYSQMLAHRGEWLGVRILPEKIFLETYAVKQTPDDIMQPYTVGNWIRGEWFGHGGAMKTDLRACFRTGHCRCFFVQVQPPGGIGWERCKDAWNLAVDDIQCPEGATPCQDSSTTRTARGKVGAGM